MRFSWGRGAATHHNKHEHVIAPLPHDKAQRNVDAAAAAVGKRRHEASAADGDGSSRMHTKGAGSDIANAQPTCGVHISWMALLVSMTYLVHRNHSTPAVMIASLEAGGVTAEGAKDSSAEAFGALQERVAGFHREQKQIAFLFACLVAVGVALAETAPTHIIAQVLGWKGWDRFSAVGLQAYFTG